MQITTTYIVKNAPACFSIKVRLFGKESCLLTCAFSGISLEQAKTLVAFFTVPYYLQERVKKDSLLTAVANVIQEIGDDPESFTLGLLDQLHIRQYDLASLRIHISAEKSKKRRTQTSGRLRFVYTNDDDKVLDLIGCWMRPCKKQDINLVFQHLGSTFCGMSGKNSFIDFIRNVGLEPTSFEMVIDKHNRKLIDNQ